MANATGLATKHGLATAAAIPTTLVVYSYLETLSPPGVALVFVLFLALFNGLAALLGQSRRKQEDRS
jgi:hypothetical protein